MQIVIDIDEDVYTRLFDNGVDNYDDAEDMAKAIRTGKPLPKGHGRLGDLDKIWNVLKELEEYYRTEFLKKASVIHESNMNGRLYGFTKAKFIVQDAPIIIEADKEVEE